MHTQIQVTSIPAAMARTTDDIPDDCQVFNLFHEYNCFLESPRLLHSATTNVYSMRVERSRDKHMKRVIWGLPFNARSIERPHYYVPGFGLMYTCADEEVRVKEYKYCDGEEKKKVILYLSNLIPQLTKKGKVYRDITSKCIDDTMVVFIGNDKTVIPHISFTVTVWKWPAQKMSEYSKMALSNLIPNHNDTKT